MPYQRNFALLAAGTLVSAAPTLADETLGAAIPGSGSVDEVSILVQSTAGTGVLTAALKLWGYNPELDRWFDLGALTTIEESAADTLSWAQGVQGLSAFSRLYIQIVSLGGTNTAIKVDGIAIQKTR